MADKDWALQFCERHDSDDLKDIEESQSLSSEEQKHFQNTERRRF